MKCAILIGKGIITVGIESWSKNYEVVTAAQMLQDTLQKSPREDAELLIYEGKILIAAFGSDKRPESLLVTSSSAYSGDETTGYTDILKELSAEELHLLGRFGWIDYTPKLESFSVTITRVNQKRSEVIGGAIGAKVLPAPLIIPVGDIIHAVAA